MDLPLDKERTSAQLLERCQYLVVVPRFEDVLLDLLEFHNTFFIHDDSGALGTVQRLEIKTVFLGNFPMDIGQQPLFEAEIHRLYVRRSCPR
jgi:hypothetical protein